MLRRVARGALALGMVAALVGVPVAIHVAWSQAAARAARAQAAAAPAAVVDTSIPVARPAEAGAESPPQRGESRASRSEPIPRATQRGFAWPVRGMITSPFGPRREKFHHGVDIGCAPPARIGASRPGRVVFAGPARSYGNVVMIDHGGTWFTVYGHLSEVFVAAGDAVAQRQAIGVCGETGNATGTHLHFEIRWNGYVWDPLTYLKS